jgi:hypothetical protein
MVAADSVCGRIDDAVTAEFMPMATSFSPTQLERFRREAKKLSRELSITHSAALDRIAARHGFQNWSLFAKNSGLNDLRPLSPASVHSMPSKRYYLHGDVVEGDATKCYCARCDLLVELSHFEGGGHHADGKDGERYLASLARHDALPPARKALRGRPSDAPNVLAARAFAEREAYEASRSPFHRWLEGQQYRNDVVGDLAGDILRDKSFPVELSTRRQIEDHLSWHGDHIVDAIHEAWREFVAS